MKSIDHVWVLFKAVIFLVLVFAICFVFGSCADKTASDEDIIAPVVRNTESTSKPPASIEITSPSPTPTIEVEVRTYNVSDFTPADKTSITYYHSKNGKTSDSFNEYISEKNRLKFIQGKIFSYNNTPTINIHCYSEESIKLVYIRPNTPFVYDFTSSAKNTGEVLLQEPIQLGNSWNVKGGVSAITSVGMLVDLPIGQVRVVEVTTTKKDNTKLKRLFLEGVGIVAEYEYDSSNKIIATFEAQAYDVERKHEESINVYYASRKKEIFWVLKRTEIGFDASMENIFKNHLQAKPGDLVALGRDVKINKIRLENDGVRIDFSSAMAHMSENANMSIIDERYFLQAITNTFANYYKVGKVYIDINGEPYASKNMVLTDSDYFEPNVSQAKKY